MTVWHNSDTDLENRCWCQILWWLILCCNPCYVLSVFTHSLLWNGFKFWFRFQVSRPWCLSQTSRHFFFTEESRSLKENGHNKNVTVSVAWVFLRLFRNLLLKEYGVFRCKLSWKWKMCCHWLQNGLGSQPDQPMRKTGAVAGRWLMVVGEMASRLPAACTCAGIWKLIRVNSLP